MVVASLLPFLHGRNQALVLIVVAALLVGLALLAFVAFSAALTTDPSPADPRLIGPFRWAPLGAELEG
jgi:hypothetical protein